MLNQLEEWTSKNIIILEKNGYIVTTSNCSNDKRSVRIDLDSDSLLARISASESGDCYMEAMDTLSEDVLFMEYADLNKDYEFDVKSKKFLMFLTNTAIRNNL
jgi:hypothetical protein